MKFIAVGMNIRPEDYDTIRNMVHVVTNETPEIYDMRCYEINHTTSDDMVFFAFGSRAAKFLNNTNAIHLGEVEKYSKDLGDPEEKRHAFKLLKQFKEELDKKDVELQREKVDTKRITKEDVISISVDSGFKPELQEWSGTTSDGRLIRVSKSSEVEKADINLTIDEFKDLTKFMEVFDIKETKIVYKPNALSSQNNNRRSSSKSS